MRAHDDNVHMKKADQTVTATDARAYTQTKITEHSLSPTPNSCTIVPARAAAKVHSLHTHTHQDLSEDPSLQVGSKCLTDVHGGRDGVLQQEDELVQGVWLNQA